MMLLLCVYKHQLLAFVVDTSHNIKALPINAELGWQPVRDGRQFGRAVQDLQQRLSLEQPGVSQAILVYDRDSAALLKSFDPWQDRADWLWQWRLWEELGWPVQPSPQQLRTEWLPRILAGWQDPVSAGTEASPLHEQAEQKIKSLEHALLAVQARLQAQDQLDGELMLTYLPALYHQAFAAVSGTDLANLIGRIEPFDIPSPYQELSGEALRQKQRLFQALPRAQQHTVLMLARAMPQRLKPRPEIKTLIEALEHDQ